MPNSNPDSTPLIELDGVCRVFEGEDGVAVRALDDISLQVRGGEFVCITGPSGSGKSTLMNIIGCLDRPTTGDYRVAGTNVATIDDDGLAALRRHAFGFVFQSFNLLESLTALRNVELPATYANAPNRWRHRRAREILGSIGLGDRIDHRAAELSGGEQQRVAIGRALMNDARVILADEPTGALDTAQGDEILTVLEELAGRGKAVIVVSHDPDVATRAHRRVHLADGRLANDDGPGPAVGPLAAGKARIHRGAIPWMSAVASGWASIRSHRLGASLTVASVAIGIWSVVALLGLAEGAHREALGVVDRMGANRLTVRGYEIVGTNVLRLPQTLADAEAIAEEVANVRSVVPWLVKRSVAMVGSQQIENVRVRAVELAGPRTNENVPWPLESGTFPSRRDSDALAQVAVIGRTVRDRLFGPASDPLGETIYFDGLPFEVTGVLAPHPFGEGEGATYKLREAGKVLRENVAFIPFRTGVEVLFGTDVLNRIEVFVDDVSLLDKTARDIRDLMNRSHGREGYTVENDAIRLAAFKRLSGLHAAVLGTLAAVALLVGGFGIVAVTLAAVSQRTREIGIRMAVGARRRDITAQFLVETVVATTLGGVIGALLGFAGSPLLSHLTDAPVAFAPWFVPLALGCAVAAGLLFGIVPARRASRLDPVAALSAE